MENKKKRKEVHVVECPPAFPPGWGKGQGKGKKRSTETFSEDRKFDKKPLLDFGEVSKEIRELGSTTFTGYEKKLFKERKYEELTGRKKARDKIPIKILRGIKAKQRSRVKKIEDEAKESGVVIARKKKAKSKFNVEKRKSERTAGPAPNIGFMMKGAYRVNKKR
mmetsp:Transcript_18055/g.23406  ORF Transcript_18055/g.23406 Transcript_18055/m.23406 type:complete len:165 (-) Transcript_18055:60-554(-)|eukprot:CAMPEP_0116050720 /NCGR_PEP_ID=MMETSP0322-20121206/549_1 /TAXON_ID=163516 /ORGANISM="Leptocylindrus danicus var. apora, Strain B651" /LENGTH=164 /DNA_ID=CAMNT_0003533325 /DNA_START=40 /DNA_END=534 /DNA_ORIENTATION=+